MNSLYFLLKEIYYYGFQQEQDVRTRFLNALQHAKKVSDGNDNEKDKHAMNNFFKRVCNLKGKSFGEICQQIMTDYELQNNKEIYAHSEEKGKYEHYPILLNQCIKMAFVSYLKNSKEYKFLKNPKNLIDEFNKGETEEKKFCTNWKGAKTFEFDYINSNPMILSWYITAHFMNPKHLNHLIGSIRGYICYIEGIESRADSVGMKVLERKKEQMAHFQQLASILEFTLLYVEQMTYIREDYFDSNEEYAEHLSKYLDLEKDGEESALKALKDFCDRDVNGGHNDKVGIYYDGENPIINRNIVKAIMYGNEKLLSSCVEPITYDEIEEYYKKLSSLQDVFKKGSAQNKDEQIKLREFQNEKNRIELVNLSIYSEIVNELMSKLVSWAYLRERDLMYFQLGWWYIKLFYTDSIRQEDKLRQIHSKEIDIKDGTILYQIIAMYTHGVPIYKVEDGEWKGVAENKSTGAKVTAFVNEYGNEVYMEGLRLFEIENAHDNIVDFRNYIDHFKYQAKLDKNILELYSFYYDMMFSYSPKLRKSVPVVFGNILKRNFAIAAVKFNEKYDGKYKATSLQITDKIKSEKFKYKFDNENPLEIDARGEIFLTELKKILEYKLDKAKDA